MSEEILINGKKITELSDMFFEYCKLKKENEELRQVRKNAPDIQEPYIYLYRQIKKQCHKLEEENKRYKQALEEIREICKCSKEPLNCDKCPQNDDCEELCINDENLQDIILAKVNEVLNDRD